MKFSQAFKVKWHKYKKQPLEIVYIIWQHEVTSLHDPTLYLFITPQWYLSSSIISQYLSSFLSFFFFLRVAESTCTQNAKNTSFAICNHTHIARGKKDDHIMQAE